ncbi:IclR family transcriptional regulator [Niallia sp. NCCP-28]|uniref:IclR family transcriptional regulator n=1 Tax=Niallia sp. NCCP-28 TaxID=2934712 RepID=UPI002083402D|nr:IclR family transcriptional regulator [Niallia sp. NCCP-28]GKU81993.1 IclR family transcriptional regulator [Niallia sp. NCCP-28]
MPIIQSVERSLRILDLFNEHTTELKITEISDKMGLHKSTVHSLLKTLQESRYIDQNPENGKYKLGMKLVERGNLVISTMDIRNIAKKYLQTLSIKTGQTSHLGILDGNAGVYIDKEEGEKALIRYSRIGRRIPLHSTAIGKVLLSFQNSEKIAQLLDGYLYTQSTNKTILNEEDFRIELERVRENGIAIDNEENEKGVRCIAVPIINQKNQVIAAVSISTLISNVDDQKLDQYAVLLKQIGQELSKQVEYGLPIN